jgi:hypothetical protein
MANTLEILTASDGRWVRDRGARSDAAPYLARSLPMVQPDLYTAGDRRIGSKVLLHGTPAAVLDRGAALDDEGDRGGPTRSTA